MLLSQGKKVCDRRIRKGLFEDAWETEFFPRLQFDGGLGLEKQAESCSIVFMKVALLALLTLLLVSCERVPKQDIRELHTRSSQGEREPVFPSSLAAWETRAAALRLRLLTTCGLFPARPSDRREVERASSLKQDGYNVTPLSLVADSGLQVDGSFYLPLNRSQRVPAVLLAHGHKPQGRFTHEELFSQRAFARHLAQNGVAVFSYSMLGYNESRELVPHSEVDPKWHLWGINLMSLQLQNSQAAFDYLAARPEVDSSRVAMVGWSGGGTQTYLLSAIEQGISAALPCAVLSATVQDDCACGGAPSFRLDTASTEFAALTSPRPQLVVTADDFTWDFPAKGYPFLRYIYYLYGAEKELQTHYVDTIWHNFNQESRRACYRFLAEHFHSRIPLEESGEPFEEPRFATTRKSDRAKFSDILEKERKSAEQAVENSPPEKNLEDYRKAYEVVLPLQFPERLLVEKRATTRFVSREFSNERVPCYVRLRDPEAEWTVLLTREPTDSIDAQVERLPGNVLVPLPLASRDRAALPKSNPTSYNKTLTIEQLQDCLTIIALAIQESKQKVKVVGVGEAAAWAILLRPFLPTRVVTEVREADIPQTDAEFVDSLFVPSIRRIGDFRTALALSSESPFIIVGQSLEREEKWLRDQYGNRWLRR